MAYKRIKQLTTNGQAGNIKVKVINYMTFTLQDFVFTSRATIDRLDNDLWWYMSCSVCNKMCTKIANKYHCSKCNTYPEATTPR